MIEVHESPPPPHGLFTSPGPLAGFAQAGGGPSRGEAKPRTAFGGGVGRAGRQAEHPAAGAPLSLNRALGLDGRSHGNAPIREVVDLMPGSHEVSCAGKVVTITVRNGQVTSVDVTDDTKGQGPVTPPPETERGDWLLPATLGGIGVIGVGVGVVLGVMSSSAKSDAETSGAGLRCATPTSRECADVLDATNRANGTGTGAIVGYAVGGAFLAGAVVSALVIQPWKERPKRVSVVPGLGGAMVVGTF